MKMMLAENIRRFRKERMLTQEQLSEALGVTAGAVYKWEAKLSVPELNLLMEMADFFDTSVDVLLGYEMKDNRLETTVKRLQEYRRRKDPEGLAEAEKAIRKYPNSFAVIRECARLYVCFGCENHSKDHLRRALELLEKNRLLLEQNTDPRINEQTLFGEMATVYLGLEESDKAIELMKAHNAGGMFNHRIGFSLVQKERAEEAVPFLSEAFVNTITNLIYIIMAYIDVFFNRGDYASAEAILHCGTEFFLGLRKEGRTNYLDKINSGLFAALAGAQFLSGQREEALASLEQAHELAVFFDASPSYDESDIRFITRIEGASAYDDIGATALDVINNVVTGLENESFAALWKSVTQKEKNDNE